MDITLCLISHPDIPSLVDRQAPNEKTLQKLIQHKEQQSF